MPQPQDLLATLNICIATMEAVADCTSLLVDRVDEARAAIAAYQINHCVAPPGDTQHAATIRVGDHVDYLSGPDDPAVSGLIVKSITHVLAQNGAPAHTRLRAIAPAPSLCEVKACVDFFEPHVP